MMRAAGTCLALLLLGGCRGSRYIPPYGVTMAGDPQAGRQIIEARHCGVCHDISDVTGAAGVIGPPLDHFAARSFIAGRVPNTPGNLITWIRSPQSVDPRTAMPAVGLGDRDARNVAAYLYTLR